MDSDTKQPKKDPSCPICRSKIEYGNYQQWKILDCGMEKKSLPFKIKMCPRKKKPFKKITISKSSLIEIIKAEDIEIKDDFDVSQYLKDDPTLYAPEPPQKKKKE